jgi:hypothetical protein
LKAVPNISLVHINTGRQKQQYLLLEIRYTRVDFSGAESNPLVRGCPRSVMATANPIISSFFHPAGNRELLGKQLIGRPILSTNHTIPGARGWETFVLDNAPKLAIVA